MGQIDASMIGEIFLQIVKNLQSGVKAYIDKYGKLTAETMMELMKNLNKWGDKCLIPTSDLVQPQHQHLCLNRGMSFIINAILRGFLRIGKLILAMIYR